MISDKPLNPDKQRRLLEFLGALPAAAASKLFAALERDRAAGGAALPHDVILDRLREEIAERGGPFPARPRTAQRLFFTPFEDFFIAHRRGRKRRARIARQSVAPIWEIVKTDAACASAARAATALDSALRGAGANVAALEEALFNAAGQGLGRLLAHAEADAAFREDLAARLGGGPALHDLAEIHLLLHGVDHLKALQAAFEKPIATLTEEDLFEARRLYAGALAEAPDVAPYLLLALAGRLDAPWRALRVHYHFAAARDAALAGETGIIVETLFEDLEGAARLLERDIDGALNADDAGMRVGQFADFAAGLVEEARRAGDNVVINRVAAGRDVAAESLARFAEQSLAALRRAMPVRHAGGSSRLSGLRPDYGRAINPDIETSARDAAKFLADAEEIAARLGRPDAAGGVVADAAGELRRYAGDLVTEIRAAEGEDRAAARRLMKSVLSIAAPLLPESETALLGERANAAALTA